MTNLKMVAVYKDKDNCVSVISGYLKERLTDCKLYEAMGYKLDSCVITNDCKAYARSKMKARLLELREYTERTNKYAKDHEGECDPVTRITLRMMHEHEETLMSQVAICVSRCLSRGVDVTDELAIACHNYRQANVRGI